MNWKEFFDGNSYPYNHGMAIRFRKLNSKKNWTYSDEFLVIPEPNWAGENNSESDSECFGTADEYELKLINTFGGLFLYINDEPIDNYDVEYKLRTSNQNILYNDEFIHEIQGQLLTISILDNSHELLKEYFKLHKKTDPTSQKEKIEIIKEIINNVLGKYHKEDNFTKFYNVWIKFEVILNIVGIRDHFIHNFETFILGLYFLDPLYTADIVYNNPNENIFKWTFTSIMHDIGYGVEKSKNVLNKISDLYSDMGMNTISSRISTFNLDNLVLNELYTITLEKENDTAEEANVINIKELLKNKLKEDFPSSDIHEIIFNQLEENFNHGLVSAVFLIRQLLESKGISYLNNESFQKLLDSSLGILFHHFKPIKKISLNPKRHLMIILLIIIDELQEWGRPLESYGATVEHKRLEFELFKISNDCLLDGDVKFDITIKLKTNKTKGIIESIDKTLLDKKNKFSQYNYILGNSKVFINLNVINSKDTKITGTEIIIKDESQLSLPFEMI